MIRRGGTLSYRSCLLSDTPVYAANVFAAEGDCVLEYVSALTGDHNADVTVNVYLLKLGATSPTDGVLVDSTSESFVLTETAA